MTDPNVYPVSYELEQLVVTLGMSGHPCCQLMVEALGEYEHGTVDIENVHPDMTVEMLGKAYEDLVEGLAS